MDSLDLDTQREFLLQSLQDAASLQEETEIIVRAWRSGDTDRLAELLLEGLAENPKLFNAIVGTRNRNWVEPIRKLTEQSDNYLVIVGAMHLVGDMSVLNMLNKAGVASRQLSEADMQ